jgi:hypothetical protein
LSSYDAIAELYDPWSASVVEDVAFYLEEARRSGGPVVELGQSALLELRLTGCQRNLEAFSHGVQRHAGLPITDVA